MTPNEQLLEHFENLDERLGDLEQRLKGARLSLKDVLSVSTQVVRTALTAYAEHEGKPLPESNDLLEIQKAFVKGDPSLNALRDNVRELVYYCNCLDMGREDALPKAPERMAAHTARHIYLYLRSRAEQEGRLA